MSNIELSLEMVKIMLCSAVILNNIVSLVRAERAIARFYACVYKVSLIKNTSKEEAIFDTRNNFYVSVLVWGVLVFVLVYWTATKINVVPIQADIGILIALVSIAYKDIRNTRCSLISIRRLLQVRKTDKCINCEC